MEVRIFKPAKTAMQSGRNNIKKWVLEFEPTDRSHADQLMGWAGSSDTSKQVALKFDSKEEAVSYAKKRGFAYTVSEEKIRKIKPKSYSDNFANKRIFPWTH